MSERQINWRRARIFIPVCLSLSIIASPALAASTPKPTSKVPATQPAATQPTLPQSTEQDGQFHQVTDFKIVYTPRLEALPGGDAVINHVAVGLVLTKQGFVAPRPQAKTSSSAKPQAARQAITVLRLADLPHLSGIRQQFSDTALLQINRAIVDYFNRAGFLGIRVQEDPADIDPQTLADLRPARDTAMRIQVAVAVVTNVRTLASGDRIPEAKRIDNPLNKRILNQSPVQVGDPVLRNEINDYVDFLNRHPGRHVDVALSRGQKPGGVDLDYLVAESRPWTIYAQASNTGTESTNEWRERFGFTDNQLTNHNDVLSIEYLTGGFDQVNGVSGSYEAPLSTNNRLRWGVTGNWGDYTASDVGALRQNFTGSDWNANAYLALNVIQIHKFFVDVIGGARWEHVEVSNNVGSLTNVTGTGDFFLPRIGVRFEQQTQTSSLHGVANLEFSMPALANSPTEADLNKLGRLNADRDWTVLHWNIFDSFYLEPLLNPKEWASPSLTPQDTLVNELAFGVLGQYAFDHRLIPQEQQVVGGLYTVRGYPESVTAGDTAVIGRAEYRYHLAQSLPFSPAPGNLFGQAFRFTPQHAFGRTDWDLILRAFTDAGYVASSKLDPAIERDQTLWSAGVGAEFIFKRNLSLSVDWGVALLSLEDAQGATFVTSGSSRISMAFTVLY